MRVVIAGSRSINDFDLIKEAVERSGFDITEVVSGTARGADRLGEHWARTNNVPIKMMPADWDKNGKAAGYIRNREMAEYADAAIIIWDGESRGSKNMIDEMVKKNKPHYILTN